MYDILLTFDNWARIANYYLFHYWNEYQDPRTKHLPFIDITPVFPIITFTFYYILVTKLIPDHMKDRQPYDLRKVILVYNAIMALGNLWSFIETWKEFHFSELLNVDFPTDKTSNVKTQKLIMMGYMYLISKMFDLLDTVFFALRKKDSHITMLHLYHHISVPIFGWLLMKIAPFVPGVKLFTFMNTLIHFIMYSYYFLSAFGPQVRKYLWWKKYITLIQLAQFIVLGVYGFIFIFFQRGYPAFWLWIAFPQPLFFFYMFYDFYKRTYEMHSNNDKHISNGVNNKIE